jgi:hypothetical protein
MQRAKTLGKSCIPYERLGYGFRTTRQEASSCNKQVYAIKSSWATICVKMEQPADVSEVFSASNITE